MRLSRPLRVRRRVSKDAGSMLGVVLTCDPSHGPRIIRLEHLLQNHSHNCELCDAAHCGGDERGADAECESLRDDRVEEDKGEREPDVGPRQVFGGLSGAAAVHVVERWLVW